jgi:hypothetical protein
MVVVAGLALALSLIAHAAPQTPHTSAVARRALNDKAVKSSKIIHVNIAAHAHKVSAHKLKKGESSFRGANTVRATRVINLKASELRAKKGGK